MARRGRSGGGRSYGGSGRSSRSFGGSGRGLSSSGRAGRGRYSGGSSYSGRGSGGRGRGGAIDHRTPNGCTDIGLRLGCVSIILIPLLVAFIQHLLSFVVGDWILDLPVAAIGVPVLIIIGILMWRLISRAYKNTIDEGTGNFEEPENISDESQEDYIQQDLPAEPESHARGFWRRNGVGCLIAVIIFIGVVVFMGYLNEMNVNDFIANGFNTLGIMIYWIRRVPALITFPIIAILIVGLRVYIFYKNN